MPQASLQEYERVAVTAARDAGTDAITLCVSYICRQLGIPGRLDVV